MSSRSKMVQVTRSLIVLDPQSMPANLGYTTREDYPEQAFPAIAYDGHNVLPTALGYMSYFGEQTRLNIGDLADYHVQHVFQYQSVNMRTLSVALLEEGIAIANGSEGVAGFEWQLVIDLSDSAEEGVRRLWTYCVIGNKLYCYLQGQPVFYGIVNAAEYEETTIPTPIEGASIEQEWFHAPTQTGILAYTPNFINMEGQMGIFKAGNRLGFWDSENAVAWSSATQIYDFKPSTTTFAGVTTFTDVVGRIVAIKQHASGFIIYATRSIVLVTPIAGSPEKWSGAAIFSDVGVIFDSQVVVAQPDNTHYAITSAGLARIIGGRPEIIEVEVMDYVRNNNKISGISFVDSRYLFIHVTNDFDSAVPDVAVIRLPDSEGNRYNFPRPVEPTGDGAEDLLAMLNAMLNSQQAEFTAAQEPIADVLPPAPDEALLPCWDVRSLNTNFTEDAIPTNARGGKVERLLELPCSTLPSGIFELDTITSPPWSGYYYFGKAEIDSYYYDIERDAIDLGAFEFTDKYLEETGKIIMLQQISNQAHETLGSVDPVGQNGTGGNQLFWNAYKSVIVPTNIPLGLTTYNQNRVLLEEIMHDQISTIETRMTDCGIDVFTYLCSKRAQLTMPQHTENVVPAFTRIALGFFFVDGEVDTEWYGYTAQANRYYFGATDADAAMWAMVARQASKPGLNWNTRTSQSIRINTGTGQIVDADFLNSFGIDTNQVPLPPPDVYEFRHTNPSSSNDSASWVPTEFPGLWPENVLAVQLGRTPSVSTESSQVDYPINPGDLSPECGTNEDVFGPNGYTVIQSPPIGARRASATKRTVTHGGTNQGSPENPVCVRLDISSRTDQAFVGGFGLIIMTLGIVGKSPQQVYEEFLADPQINPDDWSPAALSSVQANIQNLMVNQPRVAQLASLTTTLTHDAINVEEEETSLFRAEVSGYGYYPKGGFSFRKTHRRSIFKECGYSETPVLFDGAPSLDSSGVKPTLPSNIALDPLRPPYSWDYPDLPPFPPNYVIFQEGTFAPYYPTYKEAVVLDTHYTKWGRYNNQHKLVYSLFPINRVDQTIVPTESGVLRGGALMVNGECSIFSHANNNSRISYGKIGDYRLGWTRATKTVAQFAYPANAYVVVETSLNGDVVDPQLSQATEVPGLRRVELPFTLEGKWFNIRFEGQFNIVGVSLESQARSRR